MATTTTTGLGICLAFPVTRREMRLSSPLLPRHCCVHITYVHIHNVIRIHNKPYINKYLRHRVTRTIRASFTTNTHTQL